MPRSRVRPSPRKTSAPARYFPTRRGRGETESGSLAATVQPRRRRLTFDTATSFLLHFYIIVAHPSRPSTPVRTLISSLYFDKSRDGPVLLRADGELTACFFGANDVPGVQGAPLIICGRLECYIAHGLTSAEENFVLRADNNTCGIR